ncbi:iron ABC transporter permease [Actinomadura meridiana]|uniref:Iron ABC transporter permease n=1 Tax=Actinomadura meridiana TaxID=559626 RepID=A0ABP8C4R3_9ACTN
MTEGTIAGASTRTSGRDLRRWAAWVPSVLITVVTVWLFVLPLLMLAYGAVRTSPFPVADWTLDGVTRVFGRAYIWRILGITVAYSAAVASLGTCAAIGLLLISQRSLAPMRRAITPSMVILLAVPKSYYALAWAMAGAGDGGLVNKGLAAAGADGLAHGFSTHNWYGVIAVSTIKTASIAYLLLLGPLRAAARSSVEAARVCGAGPVRAFLGIEVPSLAPALLGTTLLGFVLTMQEFEVPAILGLGANIRVFSTTIYTYLQDPLGPDYSAASTASMILVLLVLLCVAAQIRMLGDRAFATVQGRAAADRTATRSPWRWALTAVIAAWIVVTIALPFAQMLVGSFQSYFGVFDGWTIGNYRSVLADPATRKAILVTVVGSAVGGAISVLLSFCLAYVFVRGRGRLALFARLGSWVPATMPGLVFGLALLWVYAVVPGLNQLFGTPFPLLIGLLVSVVPFAVRALESSLVQVSGELEEAARVSGDSFAGEVRRVLVPLMWPALASAWVLVVFVMSGTLDVPLLLAQTGTGTVSTVSYSLFQNGGLAPAAALYCTALAFFLLLTGALGAVVVGIRTWSARRGTSATVPDEGRL